jgi:hypothetical protein
MHNNRNILWYRWTAANALSELLGLGTTFAAIGLLVTRIDTGHIPGILLAFGLTVLSGAIEATLVGLAQHWALHPSFPQIGRFAWWRATLVGALLGYVLGYLPSTLMSMGQASNQAVQAEPPQWLTLLLAAGLGAAAGAVLSFAQWLVLRGKARRAGLWIPANMLAWACGMPVIFWGMDLAFKQAAPWLSVLVIAGAILLAGAVVGAIHGRFLVLIAEENRV